MNTEDSEQDLKRRLQQLEASIPTKTPQVTTESLTNNDSVTRLNKFINLFKSLPNGGKVIVVGIGVIVSFAVIKSLLNLVAALFSLTFLGLVAYFVYRFVVTRSSSN